MWRVAEQSGLELSLEDIVQLTGASPGDGCIWLVGIWLFGIWPGYPTFGAPGFMGELCKPVWLGIAGGVAWEK